MNNKNNIRQINLLILLATLSFSIAYTQSQKHEYVEKNDGICHTALTEADWQAYLEMIKSRREKRDIGTNLNPPTLNIPVVFHIVQNQSGEGPSIEEVNQALTWVNEAYLTVDFHFFQCAPPNIIHSNALYDSTFVNSLGCGSQSLEYQLDGDHHIDDVINIYCVKTGGASWSSFPSWAQSQCKDWIIYHRGHLALPYLLPHELGHYFGLLHTFEDAHGVENVTRNSSNSCYNCNDSGDFFCDTPADHHGTSNWSAGCIADNLFDSCGAMLHPDGNNFMSYSNSDCLEKQFSTEQREHMYEVAIGSRSYLDCDSDCENGLVLSGEHLSNRTFRSSSFIESSAEVYPNDHSVTYQAETYIDLNIGFRATANSIFIARLANCIDDEFEGATVERNTTRGQNFTIGRHGDLEMEANPNPFSMDFLITFTLPHPAPVSLRLLDPLGRPCRIILAGEGKEAGVHSTSIDTEGLPSGVYFLELTAGKERLVQKVVKFQP